MAELDAVAPVGEEDTELSKKLERTKKFNEQIAAVEKEPSKVGGSAEAQKQLVERLREARDIYDTRATRNDWLEVAQNLAQAVARYGAAQQGLKSGVDMTIPEGMRTDYGARTEGARKDYMLDKDLHQTEYKIGEADRAKRLAQEEASKKQRIGTIERERRSLETAEKGALDERRLKQQGDQAEKDRAARMQIAQMTTGAANQRNAASIEAANRRHEATLAYKDKVNAGKAPPVDRQLEAAKKTVDSDLDKLLVKESLINNVVGQMLASDGSDTEIQKIITAKADEAGKAGTDINQIKQEYDKIKQDEPGLLARLWGKLPGTTPVTPTDSAAMSARIRNKLLPELGRIPELKKESERLHQLYVTPGSKYSPSAAEKTAPQKPAAPEPRRTTMGAVEQWMAKYGKSKDEALQFFRGQNIEVTE